MIRDPQVANGIKGPAGPAGPAGADGLISDMGYQEGLYYTPSFTTGFAGNVLLNSLYLVPFYISSETAFDRISVRPFSGHSGTTTVRLGIYTNLSGYPSVLVNDFGTVNVNATFTTFSITIDQSLQEGWYWLAFVAQSASGTPSFFQNSTSIFFPMKAMNANYSGANIVRVTGVTGALPEGISLGAIREDASPTILLRSKVYE
jgi:hypothetical protein